MPGVFERTAEGGAAVVLDRVEASILRHLTVQLLELIGPAGDGDDDPLAALLSEGPRQAPSDPVLARLFPDAYGGPGAEQDEAARAASAEFRRYTENELRARKRADGLALVRKLDEVDPGADGGAVVTLGPEESRRWLGALNDLRLALGTRLEIRDEDDGRELFALPDSDPRKPMVMAYLWLGGLQESLVEALAPPE